MLIMNFLLLLNNSLLLIHIHNLYLYLVMATSSLSGCVFKFSTVSFTHSGTTVSTRPLKYKECTQNHLEQACKALRE